MGENKRNARRLAVEWTVELTDRAGNSSRSRIINISQTGILFMSTHHFASNDMLKMMIDMRTTDEVCCVARIVRELPGSRRFRAYAAEFVHFTPEGKHLFDEMLADVLKRAPAERMYACPGLKNAA